MHFLRGFAEYLRGRLGGTGRAGGGQRGRNPVRVGRWWCGGPWVGLRASGEPWALGRNPVGIGGEGAEGGVEREGENARRTQGRALSGLWCYGMEFLGRCPRLSHFAPSGQVDDVVGVEVGRCPRLSHFAPLGPDDEG